MKSSLSFPPLMNKHLAISPGLILFLLFPMISACSRGTPSTLSARASRESSPSGDLTATQNVVGNLPVSPTPQTLPTIVTVTLSTLTPTLVATQTPDEEGVRISQLCNGEHAPVGIIPDGIWLLEKSNQDGLWMTKSDVSSAKRIVEAGDMDTLRLSLDYSNLVITNFNAKPRQFTVMSSDGEDIRAFNWENDWPLEPAPNGILWWSSNMFLQLSGKVNYETGYGDFYFISPYTGEVYKQISDNLFFANINGDLTRMVRGGDGGLELIDIDRNLVLKMLDWVEGWLFRGIGHYWSRDGQLYIYYSTSSQGLFNIVVIDKDGKELYKSRFESLFSSFRIQLEWAELSPSHRFIAFWSAKSDQETYWLYVYDFLNQQLYDYCIFHDEMSDPQIIWSPDSKYVVAVDQQGVGFYLDIHSGNAWMFPKDIKLRGWAK